MKKLILTAIGLVAGATLVHAQGYIEMYGSSAGITTNLAFYGSSGSNTVGKVAATTAAGTYDYALLYATTTTAGDSSALGSDWSLVTEEGGAALLGNNFVNDPGGLTGPGASSGVQIDLAIGTTYDVMLVGWSSALGGSWSSVEQYFGGANATVADLFIGNTGIGTVTPFSAPGAGDPPVFTQIFAAGSLQLDQVPVPEPASLALAGLGGLSMLFLRRRKS